jgi:hypothetical protein
VSADLTIEQLAAESGMTVRNIRTHQARGLLAPIPWRPRFVQRFVADVWREFEQAGMPKERRPQVNDAIERLRRVAPAAVAADFAQRLDARIGDAFRSDGDP